MSEKGKTKKLRPYPAESPCPCGSELTYSQCCQSKAFKYEIDSKNNIIRSVALPPALIADLRKQQKDFKKRFGRKPAKGDKIFFQQYGNNSADHYRETLKETALSVGVPPATVYAMWKTGLMPMEGLLDRFTELELDEFEIAAEEYRELSKRGIAPFDEGPRFSKKQERKFTQLLEMISESPLILASIIDRGSARQIKPADFFQMLFASQALHFLRRFCSTLRLDDFDGGLNICRSIYEAFLRIRYLRYRPNQAQVFLALAGVGKGTYQFERRANRTDWNTIVNTNTGKSIKVGISNFEMAASSGKNIDTDVYNVLFRFLSGAVHPNVDFVDRHFSIEKGFAVFVESNPFEGLLISSFILILLFSEISQFSFLRNVQCRDARYQAKKIAKILTTIGSHSLSIFPGEFGCLRDKIRDTLSEIS